MRRRLARRGRWLRRRQAPGCPTPRDAWRAVAAWLESAAVAGRSCRRVASVALAGLLGCALWPLGQPLGASPGTDNRPRATDDRGWHSAAEGADDAAWDRTSRYVEMRDGVRLAIDLYLPDSSMNLRQIEIAFMLETGA